jgi:small subunit ribosomal protein S8
MSNDLIADTLARLKNAVQRQKKVVEVVNTNMVVNVLEILEQESFIGGFEVNEETNMIDVKLRYVNSEPVVANFIRVSKGGQRIYVTKKEILPVMNGRGISIISTSQGLMTGAMAKSKSLGGEYICKVW